MADRRRRVDDRPRPPAQSSRSPREVPPPTSHTPSPEARRSASREREPARRSAARARAEGGDASESATYLRDTNPEYARGAALELSSRAVAGGRRLFTSEDDIFTRPEKFKSLKTATGGQIVKLVANYCQIQGNWDTFVVLYDVQFSPDEPNRRLRHEFVTKLMGRENVTPTAFVYNGRNQLWMRNADASRIPQAEMAFQREGVAGGVRCIIKRTRTFSKEDSEILQFLNVVKNRWLSDIGLHVLGRAHYDKSNPKSVREGPTRLTLWPGFFTALANFDGGMMLNVDNRIKVIRDASVMQLIDETYQRARGDERAAASRCMEQLLGSIVITQYSDKPRTYRVLDVDWASNPTKEFEIKGKMTKLVDYYQQKYNIHVRNMQQPLLMAEETGAARFRIPGQIRTTYLLPELCHPTGLTDEMRENFRLMRELATHTLQDPGKRMDELYGFMEKLLTKKSVEDFLQSWNLEFANDFLDVNGRQLRTAPLVQGPKQINYDPVMSDWTKDVRASRFHLPFNQPKNVVIAFAKQFHRGAEDFWRNFLEVGGPMGFRLGEPELLEYDDERNGVYKLTQLCQARGARSVDLVVFILRAKTKARYDDVKDLLCKTVPVFSQCIVQKTLENPKQLKSVATKIALQVGSKLGGAPWGLDFARMGITKRIMFVGVDSYHDSGSKGGARAAVAIVATMNTGSTQYASRVFFQAERQEIGDQLGSRMTELLDEYQRSDPEGRFPEMIVFYRDGVGVGQLASVVENEVKSVKSAISRKSSGTTMAFVVVTKRHNTRFVKPLKQGQNSTFTNPTPGTVVDTGVTRPNRMDFYIVAQTVRQGTVAPTYYNVISDDTDLTVDQLQQLTYSQCCVYFNWSGTVKVPGVCQYAHKLAFLIGQSIHASPHEGLQKYLFFL